MLFGGCSGWYNWLHCLLACALDDDLLMQNQTRLAGEEGGYFWDGWTETRVLHAGQMLYPIRRIKKWMDG